jgi:histidine triad (HIT) family protein
VAGDFDSSCPFCQVILGTDEDARVVCRDAEWVAFFPTDPATPGHTLVIPYVHAPDLWSLQARVAEGLIRGAMRVGRAIGDALEPEGMNLISSSGSVAEQTVYHVHLHVVPRWKDDAIGPIWPPRFKTAEQLKDDVASRIRVACADDHR